MEITKEIEEKIINFGAFNYSNYKMATILGVNESDIEAELAKDDSEFCKMLEKGRCLSDYVIDVRLFDLARNGDTKALEILKTRTKKMWG